MRGKHITVFGGSGFLGTYLVKKLVEHGALVRVVCRHAEQAKHLRVNGPTGAVVIAGGNIRDDEAVRRAVNGADAVVNLVGILFQRGRQRFDEIQAQSAERVARLSKEAGVKTLVHVSALGVEKASNARYARSKLTGEKAVFNAFPEATIIRPSVLFGIEDDFFNKFASLLALAPVFPLIGGGKTKFQPVYVGDVAQAICNAIALPESKGHIYELGGADVMSMGEVLRYVRSHINSSTLLLPIPFSLASLIASALELCPTPMLTRDQVKLLKSDNIVSDDALGLSSLGVEQATPIDTIVPAYLKRYAGRYRSF